MTPASKTSKIPPLSREIRPPPPDADSKPEKRVAAFCYFKFLIVLLHSRFAGPCRAESEIPKMGLRGQGCNSTAQMSAHETSISSFALLGHRSYFKTKFPPEKTTFPCRENIPIPKSLILLLEVV